MFSQWGDSLQKEVLVFKLLNMSYDNNFNWLNGFSNDIKKRLVNSIGDNPSFTGKIRNIFPSMFSDAHNPVEAGNRKDFKPSLEAPIKPRLHGADAVNRAQITMDG